MNFVIIVIFASILFIPINAWAAESTYWITDKPRFSYQPIVCIFEPFEPRARDVIKDAWVKETEIGIKSWEVALKDSETRDVDKWDIHIEKIPIEKQEGFDNSICRVEVRFTGIPLEDNYDAVGWETHDGNKSQIKLFYITPEICGHTYYPEYDRSFPDFCFNDTFQRSKTIGNIAAHEFGHSIGLGHFQSTDPEINKEWSIDPVSSPSIMTLAVHYDETKNSIRKLDLEAVKEIYGNRGFGEYPPAKTIESKPTPPTEPKISDTKIVLEPNKTIQAKIVGKIPDDLFSREIPIQIQIIKPDGSMDSVEIIGTAQGDFEHKIDFNSQSQVGHYKILVFFNNELVQKKSIEFSKIESAITAKNNTIPQIPEWVKNNVRWWSENKIDDKTFTQGIQFLIMEGIITIPETVQENTKTQEIPDWIKNNAEWWTQGLITDNDFLKGITFLVENGIIVV